MTRARVPHDAAGVADNVDNTLLLNTLATIRKELAKSIGENSVHGSDAADTAAKEIAQFFSSNDIVG